MKRILILPILLFLLSACSPSLESVGATAEVLAQTMMMETQIARPTKIILPTALSESTMEATELPTASNTLAPTASPTLEATEEEAEQALPSATNDFGEQKTARLRLQNDSDLIVFLAINGPFSNQYRFSDSFNVDIPYGGYSYVAYVGEGGPFNGSFTITNADKFTLVFESDKVKELGP